MHLLLVGLSHHTAAVELRERVDFSTRLPDALAALAAQPDVGELVILSTCNRAEIYASCDAPDRARTALVEFMAGFHALTPDVILPYVYTRQDEDVARHLFRVAAGLDSLVVGEPQILGQVKDSYAAAADRHLTGPLLNRLFHSSFAVGKRVRSETGLAEGAVSVSYAAVSLARKIFGRLDALQVLLLGSGDMGRLTATHFRSQQVRGLTICSRTRAHAAALAAEMDAAVIDWEERHAALEASDIVVSATGAATPVATRADLARAMHARRNRPLFVIDIAVPRDIDPSAGELDQVFLYNVDDLRAIVRENLARRSAEVERAEALVEAEVAQLSAWLRSRDAIPTVVALRQRFEAIRKAELQRLEPRMAQLGPEGRARVDEITRLIVEKLLLTPTEQLKAVSDHATAAAYSDALNRLFSLAEDLPNDAPTPREGRRSATSGRTTVAS